MVKHTQTIRRLLPTNCLSVFDHFVGFALKGLISNDEFNQYDELIFIKEFDIKFRMTGQNF